MPEHDTAARNFVTHLFRSHAARALVHHAAGACHRGDLRLDFLIASQEIFEVHLPQYQELTVAARVDIALSALAGNEPHLAEEVAGFSWIF